MKLIPFCRPNSAPRQGGFVRLRQYWRKAGQAASAEWHRAAVLLRLDHARDLVRLVQAQRSSSRSLHPNDVGLDEYGALCPLRLTDREPTGLEQQRTVGEFMICFLEPIRHRLTGELRRRLEGSAGPWPTLRDWDRLLGEAIADEAQRVGHALDTSRWPAPGELLVSKTPTRRPRPWPAPRCHEGGNKPDDDGGRWPGLGEGDPQGPESPWWQRDDGQAKSPRWQPRRVWLAVIGGIALLTVAFVLWLKLPGRRAAPRPSQPAGVVSNRTPQPPVPVASTNSTAPAPLTPEVSSQPQPTNYSPTSSSQASTTPKPPAATGTNFLVPPAVEPVTTAGRRAFATGRDVHELQPGPVPHERTPAPDPKPPTPPPLTAQWETGDAGAAAKLHLRRGDAAVTIEFVRLGPGRFSMGNDDANSGEDDARPVWPAEVGTFYMARTETTRGQITLMLGGRPASWTASDRLGDEYPADRISWNDAKRCCQAVGALLGKAAKAVRLPYEAEWEYAARTGSVPGDLRESAHVGELDEAVLHPVAQKKRNRVGLHDLIGNVEEWVEDFYDRHAYSAPAAHGPSKGEERVKRGGTSGTPTDRATPTRRARARPDVASEFTGFRLVVEPGGSQ